MTISYAPFDLQGSTSLFMKGVCKGQRKCGKHVEKFMGLGRSKSKSRSEMNDEQTTYQENINEKLREDFIKNMTSVIQKNATDVSNENAQEMLVAIKSANEFRLSNTKVEGDLKIGGLKQTNEVKVEASMDAANSVTTKINKETSTSTKNQISKNLTDKETIDKTLPGVLSKAVAAVPPSAIPSSGLVGSSSSSAETVTNIKRDDTVINKAIEKSKTDINIEDAIESAMEENISADNLQQCGADLQSANSMVYDSIEVGGTLEISDIEQTNIIQTVVDCQFSNEVMNDVVTSMITNIEKQMEESSLTEEEQEGYGQAFAASVAAQAEVSKAEEETERVQAEQDGETDREEAKQSSNFWLYFFISCCCCILILGGVAMFGMKTAGNSGMLGGPMGKLGKLGKFMR